MAEIVIRDLRKEFGSFTAVQGSTFTIGDGEFFMLLGPSGCGKTTTLRMIAGLELPTSGQILIDGEEVSQKPASQRDIAFVFQMFALYPHMNVRRNIAYPLVSQGMGRAEVAARVAEVARILRIENILDRPASGLAGGDRQRVALARAIVRRPKAFMMDEPLGALDAEFRESMRGEIKRLHIDQKATTVYVTHDQVEAMAMGDRIVVMSNAEVQQVGTPHEVYHDPSNLFVARFIGSPGMNLLSGTLRDGSVHLVGGNQYRVPDDWLPALTGQLDSDGKVIVGFRPEAVQISENGSLGASVYASDLQGGHSMLHLELTPDDLVHARVGREIDHTIGETVRFDLDAAMVRFFNPTSEKAVRKGGS